MLPVHQERLGHDVAQEAEPRHDRAERVGCGMMSMNSISRMSPGCAPLTNTGPVSGCTAPASIAAKSATVVAGRDLAVERVAGLEHDLFALADLGGGRDVRVVAVVAAVRFVAERLAAVDADGVHGAVPAGGGNCARWRRARPPGVSPRTPPSAGRLEPIPSKYGIAKAPGGFAFVGVRRQSHRTGFRVFFDWGCCRQATFFFCRSGRSIVGLITPVTAWRFNVSKER